jgi:putative ATP-dependent endonuclease of OLD family
LANPFVSAKHRDFFTFTLLDAKRDIVSELRNKRTYWGRLLSDLGLPQDVRTDLESKLEELGDALLRDSSRLSRIQDSLRSVSAVIARRDFGVHIAAVPSDLDDLVKSVDILVGESNTDALSVSLQGMGSRSLLSLMLFEAFVTDVLSSANSYTLPLTGIEEPEAHLHPHAQRAVLRQLHQLRGQVVVSTHSPYVAAAADIFSIRLFRSGSAGSSVKLMERLDAGGNPRVDNEGISLLQRYVQRRNGDVLFCRAALLYEGETEEAALPIFAEADLGMSASAAGLSLVNVNGAGNYKHFVRLLEDLGIPWFILSDADPAGLNGLAAAGKTLGRTLDATSPEVVCFGQGNDFEAQLLHDGLSAEAETGILAFFGLNALNDFKATLHGSKTKGAGVRDYTTPGWETRLLHDFLDKNKGSFGASFAEEVVRSGKAMPHVAAVLAKLKAAL